MRFQAKVLMAASVLLALVSITAFAAPPEITDGFVCPVLGGQAGGEHGNSNPGPFVEIGGGDTTIVGPSVSVPVHATNDNGQGTPGGPHASPGDPEYTAIWG